MQSIRNMEGNEVCVDCGAPSKLGFLLLFSLHKSITFRRAWVSFLVEYSSSGIVEAAVVALLSLRLLPYALLSNRCA